MADTSKVPTAPTHTPRALWRIGRGRSGGSLGCAVIARHAIGLGHKVLVADGDINNPMLSRLYPPNGSHGVERPADATLETCKVWLADTLALALKKNASVVIDMGGGDRISEELAAESDLGHFLAASNLIPTYAYFTGPERDDFEHMHRIWSSGVFQGGTSLLFLNAGLQRNASRAVDPFEWLREDPRMLAMFESGVIPIDMPALTSMKYIEEEGLSVFDAVDNKAGRSGRPLNPLWVHMAQKWLKDFTSNLTVRRW
jgi:hypothetical protein